MVKKKFVFNNNSNNNNNNRQVPTVPYGILRLYGNQAITSDEESNLAVLS